MALRTLRSPTRTPRSVDPRGHDNLEFIYPYDDDFWSSYGDFLARCNALILGYRDTTGQLAVDAVHLLAPVAMVEIMVSEAAFWSDYADSILEELYFSDSILPTAVADGLVDEIVDFINTAAPPLGLTDIAPLTFFMGGEFGLVGVDPRRERDSTIYLLERVD